MTKEKLEEELKEVVSVHSDLLLDHILSKFFPSNYYYPKLDDTEKEIPKENGSKTTKSAWDKAINLLLANEGGYVNHPNDPGGETNFGISKKSYPNEDIKNMTKERAMQIYKENYWNKCQCDSFPDRIAIALFDCAVNRGSVTAIKLLQSAIGVASDGVVGPKTIEASKKESSYKNFILAWIKGYFTIVTNKATQRVFLNGWVNRVVNIILGSE